MISHKTVIMIRHGLTESNRIGRYCGNRMDEGLSDEGRCNTKECSCRLRGLAGAAALFTGPMRRVRETAGILFGDEPATVIDDLTEIDFGDFEGKTFEELSDDVRYREWVESGGVLSFPHGESREDYIARSMKAFRQVLWTVEDGGRAVIVCHGGNIMAVMSRLTGLDYYDLRVGNLGGYVINLTTDDERILDITYDRIGGGDSA